MMHLKFQRLSRAICRPYAKHYRVLDVPGCTFRPCLHSQHTRCRRAGPQAHCEHSAEVCGDALGFRRQGRQWRIRVANERGTLGAAHSRRPVLICLDKTLLDSSANWLRRPGSISQQVSAVKGHHTARVSRLPRHRPPLKSSRSGQVMAASLDTRHSFLASHGG